jgi:hypothetical protein
MSDKNRETYFNPTNDYYIIGPSEWQLNYHPSYENMFQIASPNGEAAITMTGYKKQPGQTLRDYANVRYEAEEEILKKVVEEKQLSNGVYIETEGTYPGESKPTYSILGAVETDSFFFTFSIVTNREYYESNDQVLLKIVESIGQA